MPHIRISQTSLTKPNYQELYYKLIGEWLDPHSSGLPIIVEEGSIANLVRLYIIWDQWKDLPREDRSKMIIEAYKEINKGTKAEITLALGYDVEEAINVGLLPYKIECLLKSSEQSDYARCQEALRGFGAWERRGQLELRFADRESAQEIYNHLQKQVPGPFWAIVIEVSVEDKLNLDDSCEHSCQSSQP